MNGTVSIFLFGKKYQVPCDLTIMSAMEYAGYQLLKGCGCRSGVCGACTTLYRIEGDPALKCCLACQTKVQDNMYIAAFPAFPFEKQVYDWQTVTPSEATIKQLFPAVDACVGCGACDKICPLSLPVKQYIACAKAGDFAKCAELSFPCVMCGACTSRCPVNIPQPQIAMLARRLFGLQMHLVNEKNSVKSKNFTEEVDNLLSMSTDKLRALYEARETE